MLSKKEYILIAGIIRNIPTAFISKEKLAETFANTLEFDNPDFDREKFIEACKEVNNDT